MRYFLQITRLCHLNSTLSNTLQFTESISGIPVTAFQIYDDLSDAWSQEDDEISDQYLHLRLSHKVGTGSDCGFIFSIEPKLVLFILFVLIVFFSFRIEAIHSLK